jgi:VanZ family protein
LVYAISDELHQLFVPGRQCSFVDFVIDAAALIFALVVIRMWSLR